MKYFHNVQLRVFVKPEEESIITTTVKEFIPVDLEKEKINIKRRTALGFNQKKIIILEVKLKKERHLKAFTKKILAELADQKKTLSKQLDSRLGNECHFFIRLNKKALIEHTAELTDSGDCFHITFAVASYPKKREKAKAIVKKWMTNG